MISIVCLIEDEALEMAEVKLPPLGDETSGTASETVKWPRRVAILGHSADGGQEEAFVFSDSCFQNHWQVFFSVFSLELESADVVATGVEWSENTVLGFGQRAGHHYAVAKRSQ